MLTLNTLKCASFDCKKDIFSVFNSKLPTKEGDDKRPLDDSGLGDYQNPFDILPFPVKTEIME